jgi:hypothetical protein
MEENETRNVVVGDVVVGVMVVRKVAEINKKIVVAVVESFLLLVVGVVVVVVVVAAGLKMKKTIVF